MQFKKSVKDMKRSNFTILDQLKDKSASETTNKANPKLGGSTQKFVSILEKISHEGYNQKHSEQASQLLARQKNKDE